MAILAISATFAVSTDDVFVSLCGVGAEGDVAPDPDGINRAKYFGNSPRNVMKTINAAKSIEAMKLDCDTTQHQFSEPTLATSRR
jgi:hypothetical protein